MEGRETHSNGFFLSGVRVLSKVLANEDYSYTFTNECHTRYIVHCLCKSISALLFTIR